MLLRFLVNRSPIVLVSIGVAAAAMLGWFSYQYLYQSISQTEALGTLEPPAPIEFIDQNRVEQLHTFFQNVDALPPIDPTTVRDVFSAKPQAASPKPLASSQPSR